MSFFKEIFWCGKPFEKSFHDVGVLSKRAFMMQGTFLAAAAKLLHCKKSIKDLEYRENIVKGFSSHDWKVVF